MFLISNNADLELGTGVERKTDGTDESLVLLGIVILKTNLELDSFSEFTSLNCSSEFSDTFGNLGVCDFSCHTKVIY